jgi:nicotinamide-nucleotide adenylyltransferase
MSGVATRRSGGLMVKRGLYVGRFQPFHLGHLDAIKRVLKEVDEVVVVIGSAQYSHNVNNPFTAGERLVMVRTALRDAGIEDTRYWVVPVPDIHLHMMWVSYVEGYTPHFDVVFSNEPLTQRLFSEAGYSVKPISFFERKLYSSTVVRERMVNGETWETLVPKGVANFLKEIDGLGRLRELHKSDIL